MSSRNAEEAWHDLEIRFFPLQEGAYPVELTLDGQQQFPRGYLAAAALPGAPGGEPEPDGRRLFDLLFADPVLRSAWDQARGQAPRCRLRLWIDPLAPELHKLPWEMMGAGQPLSAGAATPFSRYLPSAMPWGRAVEERPIRILAAISNPEDLERYQLTPFDAARARASLEEALRGLPGLVRLDWMPPPITLERLEEALHQGYPVLHLLGHGAFNAKTQQAGLYLQDAAGRTQVASDEALAGLLSRQLTRPRLIFLGACQSATRSEQDALVGLGPRLVTAGVPAVVAMQDWVTMETVQQLNQAFYRRLAECGAVDRAMNEARSMLLTAGRADAAVPVLFMRLQSGRLWDDESPAPRARVQKGTGMNYQQGFQTLQEWLSGADRELRNELALLKSRFERNEHDERLFGSTEARRSERSEVIYALNEMALTCCGVSFNDLCAGARPTGARPVAQG